MRIVRIASCICTLAFLLTACAGIVARADAAPSASAAELKDAAGKAPTTATLANGDPGGSLTGTVSDVPVGDAKVGLTLGDVANQVGQNKIGINFTWTLISRLPGHVHAGRIRHGRSGPVSREERQPHLHDELLRVRVWFVRLLDHRLRHPDGRRGRQRKPRRPAAAGRRASRCRCSAPIGASSARAACSSPATPTTSA